MSSFTQTPRKCRLDVLLPMSLAEDTPHPREWTLRVGSVARTLAVFRVSRAVLYPDDRLRPSLRNAGNVKDIFDYLNTAAYLRRRLFPLKPSLRYAGLLPPLNIPTHPESDYIKQQGRHYREALVLAGGETSVLEAGLRSPFRVRRRLKTGSRVIIRVDVSEARRRFRIVPRSKPEVYSGFSTYISSKPLPENLDRRSLNLAASRLGKPYPEAKDTIRQKAEEAGSITVAFGSAEKGLHSICDEFGFKIDEAFDLVVNFIPSQGVRTIRTEEAVAYALTLLNDTAQD